MISILSRKSVPELRDYIHRAYRAGARKWYRDKVKTDMARARVLPSEYFHVYSLDKETKQRFPNIEQALIQLAEREKTQ